MTTITNTSGVNSLAGQHLEVRSSLYTAAAVAQNVILLMVPVNPGDTVYDVTLDFDALGSSTALEVGDSGSATRYIGSTVTTSAGVATLSGATVRGHTYAAADCIQVTVSGTGAITGNVRVTVKFMRTY